MPIWELRRLECLPHLGCKQLLVWLGLIPHKEYIPRREHKRNDSHLLFPDLVSIPMREHLPALTLILIFKGVNLAS